LTNEFRFHAIQAYILNLQNCCEAAAADNALTELIVEVVRSGHAGTGLHQGLLAIREDWHRDLASEWRVDAWSAEIETYNSSRSPYPERRHEICRRIAEGLPTAYADRIRSKFRGALSGVVRRDFVLGMILDQGIRPTAPWLEMAYKEYGPFPLPSISPSVRRTEAHAVLAHEGCVVGSSSPQPEWWATLSAQLEVTGIQSANLLSAMELESLSDIGLLVESVDTRILHLLGAPVVPVWDPIDRQLKYGEHTIKNWKKTRATRQECLVRAFVRSEWTQEPIANPFPDKSLLEQTVKDFMKGLKPALIEFHVITDRVYWRPLPARLARRERRPASSRSSR